MSSIGAFVALSLFAQTPAGVGPAERAGLHCGFASLGNGMAFGSEVVAAPMRHRAGLRWDSDRPSPVIAQEGRLEWTLPQSPRPWPPRSKRARGGKAVMSSLSKYSLAKREKRLVAELCAGNIPSHLRRLVPVSIKRKYKDGSRHTASIRVMPDYLSVGSDRDCVRVPLSPMAAQEIADRFGFSLPTKRMVDAIHDAAKEKLSPKPMTKARESVLTFIEHDTLIDQQRRQSPKSIVSGIKKDIVLTKRLIKRKGSVAIYGWHYPSGKPIQPLYLGHTKTYVDYSHGIRLIARKLKVDGKTMTIDQVLAHPKHHELLSDEGPLPLAARRYR